MILIVDGVGVAELVVVKATDPVIFFPRVRVRVVFKAEGPVLVLVVIVVNPFEIFRDKGRSWKLEGGSGEAGEFKSFF